MSLPSLGGWTHAHSTIKLWPQIARGCRSELGSSEAQVRIAVCGMAVCGMTVCNMAVCSMARAVSPVNVSLIFTFAVSYVTG